MKKLIFLFIFLQPILISGQDNIFLDENLKKITSEIYLNKCKSFIYNCKSVRKDSIILNTIIQSFKFGKLSQKENNQFRKLLISRTKNKKILHKTIIINHTKTLIGYTEYKNQLVAKDFKSIFTTKRYNKKLRNIDIAQKKCIKKSNKKDITTIYSYTENKNYNYNSKNYNWVKIPIISNLFLNNESGIIILNADGSYFINKSYIDNNYAFEINENWLKNKNDFDNAKITFSRNRYGFFKNKKQRNSKYLIKELNPHIKDFEKFSSSGMILVNSVEDVMKRSLSKHTKNCFSSPLLSQIEH